MSTPPNATATGGCANVVHNISRTLSKKGHHVTLLTSDLINPGPYCESGVTQSNPNETGHYEIVRHKCISKWLAWNCKLYLIPGMVRFLHSRLHEFDLVHLHDLLSPTAILTHHYCRSHGTPYTLTTHGSADWLTSNQTSRVIVRNGILAPVLNDASAVLALTKRERLRQLELGIPSEKIWIVPNGLDSGRFLQLPPRNSYRKVNGLRTDSPLVTYVGRIHHSKGLDLAVEAFGEVIQSHPSARLILAGPDDGAVTSLRRIVSRERLEGYVDFTGFLSEEDKTRLLVDSDVFVTPRFQGFPIAFLEALACGVPVVTTNNGDELDWIHDQAGFVTDYHKVEFAKAICAILDDSNLKRRLSVNARTIATNKYDWEAIADRLIDVYNRCLEKGE